MLLSAHINIKSFCLLQGKASLQPPRIVGKLMGVSADKGDRVELTASVQGDPPPTVTWFENNRPLCSNGEVVITNLGTHHSLRLESVKVLIELTTL